MNTSQTLLSTINATPRQLARAHLKKNAGFAQEARQIVLRMTEANGPGRAQLEHFIRMVFRNVYGANVTHFMPQLLSLHDQDAQVLAVCGLRQASSGSLFLEAYLDQPVEVALSERIGVEVARNEIVEIGNLAVVELGMARRLLLEVINHLHATDAQWAVFTAIPALRNSLGKLNVQLEVLCDANIDNLAATERRDWGSYYEHQPQVMAVRRLPC